MEPPLGSEPEWKALPTVTNIIHMALPASSGVTITSVEIFSTWEIVLGCLNHWRAICRADMDMDLNRSRPSGVEFSWLTNSPIGGGQVDIPVEIRGSSRAFSWMNCP